MPPLTPPPRKPSPMEAAADEYIASVRRVPSHGGFGSMASAVQAAEAVIARVEVAPTVEASSAPREGAANAPAVVEPAVVARRDAEPIAPPEGVPRSDPRFHELCFAAGQAYAKAYALRYKAHPAWGDAQDRLIEGLVVALGAEAAPVLDFFVAHDKKFYQERLHALRFAAEDAPALRTQWATQRVVTTAGARQDDLLATNREAARRALERLE